MGNVGIFVDAGYLFAAGATEVFGERLQRESLFLNVAKIYDALLDVVVDRTDGNRLLRVYWYDGAHPSYGKTAEHKLLANHDFFKLRLGLINSLGQQKGVDSLIVSDLIELARNRAIDDATLLAGDEDVRVGVQVAQTMGVRVHLLGIWPSTANQAPTLREEADTNSSWNKEVVSKFLSRKSAASPQTAEDTLVRRVPNETGSDQASRKKKIADVVDEHFATCVTPEQHLTLSQAYAADPTMVPNDHDRKILAKCGQALQAELSADERRYMRREVGSKLSAQPA